MVISVLKLQLYHARWYKCLLQTLKFNVISKDEATRVSTKHHQYISCCVVEKKS